MIQFDNFTIQTKISENQNRIQKLKRTVAKIKKNSQEIQMKAVERVNKVALFSVSLGHTSEYTLELGSDYYAKVKERTANQILENRIQFIEEQNKKWNQLKSSLIKKAEKNPLEFDLGANIQSIGHNQDGEQIFNIVQYQPPTSVERTIKSDSKSRLQADQSQAPGIIDKKINQKTEDKETYNLNIPVRDQFSSRDQKNEEKEVEIVTQKKVSKFKADRMKMKQQ